MFLNKKMLTQSDFIFFDEIFFLSVQIDNPELDHFQKSHIF